MAVHLTRIYTRTGDDGTTGLSDFSTGFARTTPDWWPTPTATRPTPPSVSRSPWGTRTSRLLEVLRQIQNDLFDAGADLSTPVVENPEYPPLRITQSYIDRLEGLVRRVQRAAARAEFVRAARWYAAVGASARGPHRRTTRGALGVARGGRTSGQRQRAAGEVPQPAVGPAVHSVPSRQSRRRRALATRRQRRNGVTAVRRRARGDGRDSSQD